MRKAGPPRPPTKTLPPAGAWDGTDLSALVACPACDALHVAIPLLDGETARCTRCATVLAAPSSQAFLRVTLLTVTATILLAAAVFFPFLSVSTFGFSNASSIFEAALAFQGWLAPLSLAVLAMIVLVPPVRFLALIYVMAPLAAGRRPLPHARRLYRLAEDLRPWSMAEVFVIGTAVALVKVAGLATVTFGPAFWAFAGMILVVAAAESFICRWTVWQSLDAAEVA